MVLRLYKLIGSPPVRSVLMVIEALKIPDIEYVDVNLLDGDHMKEEYLKLNPQHTVPVLQDDDFCICDSHAISAYLVGKFGQDDSLYPKDLKKRAIVDQRLHFDSGILFPALRGTAEPILFWNEKSFRPEGLNKIEAGYDFTEKFLNTPWLAGDNLTLADICCMSSISTMNLMLPIDKNRCPRVTEWLAKCSELEIYKKANVPGLAMFRNILKKKMS